MYGSMEMVESMTNTTAALKAFICVLAATAVLVAGALLAASALLTEATLRMRVRKPSSVITSSPLSTGSR
ncbi:hypothetical protein D3C80_2118310 [compost metagenome]